MPFVAELYFDPPAEERIREAWKTLDEAGISDSICIKSDGRHEEPRSPYRLTTDAGEQLFVGICASTKHRLLYHF